MRVVINALPAMGARTGIGYYTSELIRCLKQHDDLHLHCYPGSGLVQLARRIWVNQSKAYEADKAKQGLFATVKATVRGKLLSVVRRFGKALLPNPLENRRRVFQLYHEPNYIPLPCDIPTVASVHDLSALQHPEWHPPERVRDFEKNFHEGLKRCCHLFAISEFGRQQIIRHLGWHPDRVSVTYMGIRPGLVPLPSSEVDPVLAGLDLKPGYLLHVGTLEPRKNVRMLIEVYCSLPAAIRDKHPLVLVGGRGWNSEDVHRLIETEGKGKNVRYLGYADEEQFPALYNGARALVFPTIYEGFGIPTIEMLACGGAVLASTAGAVAETVGGQAHLMDPHDRDGWRQAMTRVCTDDEWWNQLRQGATETASRYTWERCAEDTLAVYRKLCGEGTLKRAA